MSSEFHRFFSKTSVENAEVCRFACICATCMCHTICRFTLKQQNSELNVTTGACACLFQNILSFFLLLSLLCFSQLRLVESDHD